MALARSASGPGGLSINTNSANSLFGSGTTPAAGGMFGSTQASKPAQSGGLFGTAPQSGGLFGSTATSQPASGGLFGTAQPQQSGGLFGSMATTSQPQTGALFGSTAASTQPATGGLFGAAQPQQSGGLFGNLNTSQPAQTGGIFGSSTAAQPQQGGGLFPGLGGQPAQNTNTGGLFGQGNAQPAPGGGLFGGQNTQSQAKPATPLFGGLGNTQNQQSQPQPQQSSMFSSLNQNPNQNPNQNSNPNQGQGGGGGLFGSVLGGGLSTNQPQTVPGVRVDPSQMRGTTRFNDLHEEAQKRIMEVDDYIQQQIRLKNDCEAIMPKHDAQLNQVPVDFEFCRRKLIGVESAAASDAEAISHAQKLVKTDADHARLSFRAIDNLKLPPQYHTSSIWSSKSTSNENQTQNSEDDAQDIVGFFSSTVDELATTLASYQRHLAEIEQHLRGVEANSAQQVNALVAKRNGQTIQEDPMQQLSLVLRDFEGSLLGVAGKVGGARENVQSLQLGQFPPQQNGTRRGPRNGVY